MKATKFLLILLSICLASCSDDDDKDKDKVEVPQIERELSLESGSFHFYKVFKITHDDPFNLYTNWRNDKYAVGDFYISNDYSYVEISYTDIPHLGKERDEIVKSGKYLFVSDGIFKCYFAKTTDGDKILVWDCSTSSEPYTLYYYIE